MSEKEEPFVSIITINYNQVEVTCEFLQSLENLNTNNYEVIVVDNASRENPEPIIKQKFPFAKVILSKQNLGFSGGNNLGMSVAKGDYFFIVNNDTELTENLLETLIEPFERIPSIGIVCPKIKYFHHPDVIQYAGFTPMNKFTGRAFTIGKNQKDNGNYDVERSTNSAHGAAMMVKREIIEKVGLMPELYFLYYEEWDWSTKIINEGYKVFYQPKAVVLHKESISVGKESTLKAYYHIRNRILFMRRNSKPFNFIIFLVFLSTCVIPISSIRYLKNLQFKHIIAFYKGIFWNLKSLG